MPTVLGDPYNMTIGRTPPHMSPEDEIIWNVWRNQYLRHDDKLYFDVRLGDGLSVAQDVTENVAKGWTELTQKRADLIVDRGDEWWIVEFRNQATANAVGRLLMYSALFKQDIPKQLPIKLILVTNRTDDELARLAINYKIDYVSTI